MGQAIEDAIVLAEELKGLTSRTEADIALTNYRNRRLVRSAAVQGLSRFASDIIIRGFDTPAKIVDGRLENFNYAGMSRDYSNRSSPSSSWSSSTSCTRAGATSSPSM